MITPLGTQARARIADTTGLVDATSEISVRRYRADGSVSEVVESLGEHRPILLRQVPSHAVDDLAQSIAAAFHLQEMLELQAGFADFRSGRNGIGASFMTVNTRNDYEVITPHSEGSGNVGMQLAMFYCYANGTDGGESIIFRVDNKGNAWPFLKEAVTRVLSCEAPISQADLVRLTTLHGVRSAADTPLETDVALNVYSSSVAGVTLVDVLACPRKSRSIIDGELVFTYWDSIASVDFDCFDEYYSILRCLNLLKSPTDDEGAGLDGLSRHRKWRSRQAFRDIFDAMAAIRLTDGDFLILDNLRWAHSAANWTPGTGDRSVIAAFA